MRSSRETAPILKTGELSKKGMWGRWKDRYFVLQPPLLLEYHSAKHAKAGKVAHSLTLSEITICKAEGINGQSFSFALRRKSKESFFLASDKEQEMVEWIRLMAPHVMSVNDEWAVDDEGLEKEVEAVCVTNENGYFLAANEIFCAMTGFTKEELLGKPCTLIMPASIASKHESYMSNYLKTGIKRLIGKPRRLAVKRKNDSLFLCELSLGEVIDQQKSLRRYVVHLRPIIVSEKLGNSTDEDTTETMDDLSDMSESTESTALEDSGKLARIKEKRREAVSLPLDMKQPTDASKGFGSDSHRRTLSIEKFKKKSKSARTSRDTSRDTSREASSESEGEDGGGHVFGRKSFSGLGVIAEEQDADGATPHSETPRGRRSGFCSGTNSHEMNATSAAVPYHPLIDKVGKVFDDRVAAFKQSLKRSLQEEMTTVLARVDLLDAELTETKRRAELNRLQRNAALAMVLDPENKIMKKIKRAVTAEVKSTDDEKLLFRMDSKATKKVISFMTAVGLEYLEKALGTIIRKICEDQLLSYEVNSRLLDPTDDRQQNRDQLRCISEMFATALVSSVDAVPPEFCELFKHVKKESETKWTGKVAYYQPIGGLFFLRFINAAVVSPSFFGLVQGEIGFRPQRGLILVSKLLQYVVNGLTFEPGHELYDFNDFVVAQMPAFEAFIDNILARQ